MIIQTRKILLLCFLALAAVSDGATLHLKDGSVVTGEIKGLTNGIYTVTSKSLGQIQIKQGDIETISYGSRQPSNDPTAGNAQAEIRQLQLGLASDASIMTMIQGLQSDPQLREILADPEIMRSVRAGDLGALMASEKFMALLNNSNIKAITGKVNAETPQGGETQVDLAPVR